MSERSGPYPGVLDKDVLARIPLGPASGRSPSRPAPWEAAGTRLDSGVIARRDPAARDDVAGSWKLLRPAPPADEILEELCEELRVRPGRETALLLENVRGEVRCRQGCTWEGPDRIEMRLGERTPIARLDFASPDGRRVLLLTGTEVLLARFEHLADREEPAPPIPYSAGGAPAYWNALPTLPWLTQRCEALAGPMAGPIERLGAQGTWGRLWTPPFDRARESFVALRGRGFGTAADLVVDALQDAGEEDWPALVRQMEQEFEDLEAGLAELGRSFGDTAREQRDLKALASEIISRRDAFESCHWLLSRLSGRLPHENTALLDLQNLLESFDEHARSVASVFAEVRSFEDESLLRGVCRNEPLHWWGQLALEPGASFEA